MSDPAKQEGSTHDAYLALRIRDFCLLLSANFLTSFSGAILSVVVGWYIFELTRSALALGVVGLVQIVPVLFISLPAGQYVDNHDPKRIGVMATLMSALATLLLAFVAATGAALWLLYLGLFVMGIARAFRNAVQAPLVAASVPPAAFGNASAWSSSLGQLASVLGPAVGGVSIALISGSAPVFLLTAAMLALGAFALGLMRTQYVARPKEKLTRASLFAGVHFIWRTKVLFLGGLARYGVGVARRRDRTFTYFCARGASRRRDRTGPAPLGTRSGRGLDGAGAGPPGSVSKSGPDAARNRGRLRRRHAFAGFI